MFTLGGRFCVFFFFFLRLLFFFLFLLLLRFFLRFFRGGEASESDSSDSSEEELDDQDESSDDDVDDDVDDDDDNAATQSFTNCFLCSRTALISVDANAYTRRKYSSCVTDSRYASCAAFHFCCDTLVLPVPNARPIPYFCDVTDANFVSNFLQAGIYDVGTCKYTRLVSSPVPARYNKAKV